MRNGIYLHIQQQLTQVMLKPPMYILCSSYLLPFI
jgi:hypothetical protein